MVDGVPQPIRSAALHRLLSLKCNGILLIGYGLLNGYVK